MTDDATASDFYVKLQGPKDSQPTPHSSAPHPLHHMLCC